MEIVSFHVMLTNVRALYNLPAPMQKLGERFAANVVSSSLRMAVSSSKEAGIFASAVISTLLFILLST